MKAGASLEWHKELSLWRALLVYIGDFSDLTTWGLGRWVTPGWDQPLPSVLVIDENFVKEFRGIPFLYNWRLTAPDIATLGSGAFLKGGAKLLAKFLVLSRDLGLSLGLTKGIEQSRVGVSRSSDEIKSGLESYNVLFWLSLRKLEEQGYTSYDIKDGHYVFYQD